MKTGLYWAKLWTVLLSVICIILLTFGFGHASDKTKVRVGFFHSTIGFTEINKDSGRKTGYMYDYLQTIANYTNWSYEYVYGGWGELFEKLKNGEIDIMGDISYTEERSSQMLFPSYPMGTESYYLFIDSENKNINTNNYSGLNGKKIAVGINTVQSKMLKKFLNDNDLNCEIVLFNGEEDRLKLVEEGKVDAFAGDTYLKSNFTALFKLGETNFYLAINKNRQDLLQELNSVLQNIMMTDPYFNMNLHQKYFNSAATKEPLTISEKNWLAQKSRIIIGYCNDYMPYCDYDNETQSIKGLLNIIMSAIAVRTGIKTEGMVFTNPEKMHTALMNGKIDAAFPVLGDMWTAEDHGYILSPSVYTDRTSAIYHNKHNKHNENKDCRVAVTALDPVQHQYVKCFFPKAKIVAYNTIGDCLNAIQKGECDEMFISSNVIHRYLNSSDRTYDLHVLSIDSNFTYSFAIQRDNIVLYSILSKTIKGIGQTKISENVVLNSHIIPNYSLISFVKKNIFIAFVMVFIVASSIVLFCFIDNIKKRKKQKLLQIAMAETQMVNAARSEFYSKMSHELRTPMNGILSIAELAEDENNPSQLHKDIRQIKESGKYMISLINDALDLQKMDSDKLILSPEPKSLTSLTEDAISMMSPLAHDKQLDFTATFTLPPDYLVMVDPVRYKQIIINLLSNAIKYTSGGGKVCLSLDLEKCGENDIQVKISVRDTGVGMSEEFLKNNIFKLYSQERNSLTLQNAGSGLGLAIVKNLVETMQGHISVDSQSGQGSTFTVFLNFPLASAELCGNKESQSTAEISRQSLSGVRLLLCEDHPVNTAIAVRLLQRIGCTVDCATDGLCGLEKFTSAPPRFYDAILMDIRMPVMDGLETTKCIRTSAHPDAQTIPIIALSANAYDSDIQKSLDCGMNAHLAKPIDPRLLYATLTACIEKKPSPN